MQAQDYAQALYEAVHEVRPEDHDKVLENFVAILNQNGDMAMYEQIETEYKKIDGAAHGIKQVEITSAHPIDTKGLIKDLNKIIGEKMEVREKIDKDIIGGVVVRVDDTLIDASVRNSLNNLKNIIAKN